VKYTVVSSRHDADGHHVESLKTYHVDRPFRDRPTKTVCRAIAAFLVSAFITAELFLFIGGAH